MFKLFNLQTNIVIFKPSFWQMFWPKIWKNVNLKNQKPKFWHNKFTKPKFWQILTQKNLNFDKFWPKKIEIMTNFDLKNL